VRIEKEVKENKIDKWVGYLKSKKRTDELIEELRGEEFTKPILKI